MAARSRFLAAVVDAPAVVGTSFRGGIASLYALRHAASVRGLVLSSSYLPAFYGGWRAPIVGVAVTTEQVGGMARDLRQTLLRSALAKFAQLPSTPRRTHLGRHDGVGQAVRRCPGQGWMKASRSALMVPAGPSCRRLVASELARLDLVATGAGEVIAPGPAGGRRGVGHGSTIRRGAPPTRIAPGLPTSRARRMSQRNAPRQADVEHDLKGAHT